MLRELNEDLMTQMHFVEFFFCVNNNQEVDFNNPQMMYLIQKFKQEKVWFHIIKQMVQQLSRHMQM